MKTSVEETHSPQCLLHLLVSKDPSSDQPRHDGDAWSFARSPCNRVMAWPMASPSCALLYGVRLETQHPSASHATCSIWQTKQHGTWHDAAPRPVTAAAAAASAAAASSCIHTVADRVENSIPACSASTSNHSCFRSQSAICSNSPTGVGLARAQRRRTIRPLLRISL